MVKKFHLWGAKNNIPTSTIHDAFFANAADMLKARKALRAIYGEVLERNVIQATLDEMKARGLPQELYDKYLNEAKDIGLIPISGRSTVGGKTLKDEDILKFKDVIQAIPDGFEDDYGWYGIG